MDFFNTPWVINRAARHADVQIPREAFVPCSVTQPRCENPSDPFSTPDTAPGVGTVVLEEETTTTGAPCFVILYNDDFHALDQVIHQIQKAVGVSASAAFEITMEAHTQGRAVCYTGTTEQCEKVANILREIRLTVEIDHYAGS